MDGRIVGSTVQILELESGRIESVLATEGPEVIGVASWSPDGRRLLVGQGRLTSTNIA